MGTVRVFLLLVLAAGSVSAAGEADTWAQLGLLLKGAQVGLPLADFLKNHPLAKGSAVTAEGQPADTQGKSVSAEEQYDKDPFLGLWCLANYGFKDNALTEFTVLWYSPADQALAVRSTFFRACIERNGAEFRRDALKADQGTGTEHWAPVLVWTTRESAVLASYSVRKDPKKGAHGIFTYAVLPKDDVFIKKELVGQQMKKEELDHIFSGIEPVLEKALKKADKQEKPQKKEVKQKKSKK